MGAISTNPLEHGFVTTLTGVVTLPNKQVFDPKGKYTERELMRLSKEVPNLIWRPEAPKAKTDKTNK